MRVRKRVRKRKLIFVSEKFPLMNRYFPLFNLSSVYSTNASGAELDDFSVSNAKQCIFQCLILIVECASLSLLFTRCCLSVILLFDGRLFVCLLNKTRDFDLTQIIFS